MPLVSRHLPQHEFLPVRLVLQRLQVDLLPRHKNSLLPRLLQERHKLQGRNIEPVHLRLHDNYIVRLPGRQPPRGGGVVSWPMIANNPLGLPALTDRANNSVRLPF